MKKLLFFTLMAVMVVATAYGQKQKVAVVQTMASSVSEDVKGAVQDALEEGIYNSSKYTLVARGVGYEQALKEFKFQQTGAVDDKQLTEFGHAVGADLVCYAALRSIEPDYRISYKLINVASGEVMLVNSKSTQNGKKDLMNMINAIANDIFSSNAMGSRAQTGGGSNTSVGNGQTYNPDGIELVYVEGTGTGIGAIKGFYIGKYEVTQTQWQAVTGNNPSFFKGDNNPVETVSWDDIKVFIGKLNSMTGKNYRLPTEKEWEYAAREGNKNSSYEYSGSNSIGEVVWYEDNSGETTHPVGQKKPNALGIYDMSGNVWEWCQDCYDSSCSRRVLRGGSWIRNEQYCRVSFRFNSAPGNRHSNYGFRLVLSR